VRAADGWIALNLARADDVGLCSAWLDGDIDDPADIAGMQRALAAVRPIALVARGASSAGARGVAPAADPIVEPVCDRREPPGPARLRPLPAEGVRAEVDAPPPRNRSSST
jgi:hypothetical protein